MENKIICLNFSFSVKITRMGCINNKKIINYVHRISERDIPLQANSVNIICIRIF